MSLQAIAAVAENGVIGLDGEIPWYEPEDLKMFKVLTLGGRVIMGRRTFESLGSIPLVGRTNYVLTRFPLKGQTKHLMSVDDHNDLDHGWVIGGESVYRQMLPRCSKLWLTRIHAEPKGDVFFPELDDRWTKLTEAFLSPTATRELWLNTSIKA